MGKEDIKIKTVLKNSIADEVGIEKGDRIISINKKNVHDFFDYRFLSAEIKIILKIEKVNGELWDIKIEKDAYEDIGLLFEHDLEDFNNTCHNKCIFCFIDQLPKGMRKTLYFKDDDSRLSFLHGNYVTLTNMTKVQIKRIIDYKMSPLNVSVHSTESNIRIKMLNNKKAGDIIKKLKRLTAGGIKVNCQIVLCKRINDNEHLLKTLQDLLDIKPIINSISIVPAGLTKYREGLHPLTPYTKMEAENIEMAIRSIQNNGMKKFKNKRVYLADEFYLIIDKEIPNYEHYQDFPQLENGIGMLALLKHEVYNYLNKIQSENVIFKNERRLSIATGTLVYPYIKKFTSDICKYNDKLKVNVFKIENHFFGKNINVAGLLTGQDIMKQLKDKDLGDVLLLSINMFKEKSNIFLDDMTMNMLSKNLNVKIEIVKKSGQDFVNKILGIDTAEVL